MTSLAQIQITLGLDFSDPGLAQNRKSQIQAPRWKIGVVKLVEQQIKINYTSLKGDINLSLAQVNTVYESQSMAFFNRVTKMKISGLNTKKDSPFRLIQIQNSTNIIASVQIGGEQQSICPANMMLFDIVEGTMNFVLSCSSEQYKRWLSEQSFDNKTNEYAVL